MNENRTMSKTFVEAEIKLFCKFYYEEFAKLAKFEHILKEYDWRLKEPAEYIKGSWKRISWLDTYSEEAGEKFEVTIRVCAPEWRIWGLLERMDCYGENGIEYETDFGLIVE